MPKMPIVAIESSLSMTLETSLMLPPVRQTIETATVAGVATSGADVSFVVSQPAPNEQFPTAFGMKAMDAVSRIGEAQGESQVLALLQVARKDLGCDSAIFVSFINYDDNESFRFMLDAPLSWCSMYRRKGMFAADPWLRYAAENTEPATCSKILPNTPVEQDALELARAHGAMSSYILPAPSKAGSSRVGVLILNSLTPGFFDNGGAPRVKPLARSLSMELAAWWVESTRAELVERLRISDLDLRLLRMEREGHKTKSISKVLNMSASAVDSAFHRLANKLDTHTRRASAVKATAYGLI